MKTSGEQIGHAVCFRLALFPKIAGSRWQLSPLAISPEESTYIDQG